MARTLPLYASLLTIMTIVGAMPVQSIPIVDFGCADSALCPGLGQAVPPGEGLGDLGRVEPGPLDAAASSSSAQTADGLAAKGQACMKSGDDKGLGGSSVSCQFRCGPGAVVAVGVKATDPDAWTYGNGSCDEAKAACSLNGPACAGVSDDVSKRAADGGCSGSSDEFWDSPILVACIATVPGPDSDPGVVVEDALRALCEYSDICPSGGGGPCGDQTDCLTVDDLICQIVACPIEPVCAGCAQKVEDTCANTIWRLDGVLGNLQRLLEDESVSGFVAILFDGTALLAISFDPTAGCYVTSSFAL